ncbi:MAG TPA: energy transducer TonB [Gemmatimonadales bacterium]|nr:energy transducer TonB [Gemmatimonadales bacterium]
MPMFALAEPEHSALSLLPSTVLHSLLVAAAIAASQAGPLTVPKDPIDIDLAWHPVSTTNTPVVDGGTTTLGVPPIGIDPVPDIPSLPDLPRLAGIPKVDIRSLVPGGDSLGRVGVGDDPRGTTQVLTESEVDDPPSLLAAGPLRYPPVLREAGIIGSVTLQFVIDTEGRVEEQGIEVLTASHPGFVGAATETIRASRFHPAKSHGAAVRVRVRQTISFRQ